MNLLKYLALSAWSILVPIHAAMGAAGVLILVDLVLGILAARKRGEKITSAAMRRTISKMLIYQSAVITGFLCEKYLLSNFIPVSKLVAGVIGVVEMQSILENSDTINGGPIFKKVIKLLGSKNDNDDASQDK